MPPEAVTVALPLFCPAQEAMTAPIEALGVAALAMVTETVVLHPSLAVTVTL